jgi:hypothetical protein
MKQREMWKNLKMKKRKARTDKTYEVDEKGKQELGQEER